MRSLSEYIEESLEESKEAEMNESSDEMKYTVVDVDLDDAILSVWDTKEEAEKEIADRLKENSGLNLKWNEIKASEVEKQ